MLNFIYKHCAPNSIIYSDCWASYARIRKLDKNFEHLTVNHDLYLVDPKTGVHTNGIESKWCSAKAHFKQMRGVSRNYLSAYLDEFSWRCLHKDEISDKMLHLIAKHHPPGLETSLDRLVEQLVTCNVDELDLDFESEKCDIPSFPDYPTDTENGDIVSINNNEVEAVNNEVEAVNNEVEAVNDVEAVNNEFIDTKINSILKNGGLFTFSSILTIQQRKYVHQVAESKQLFHQSTGTRYRCITVSKEPIVKTLNTKN